MHYVNWRAVKTTTCAGHRNVQSFFMTPDGKVAHCLPGFWDAKWFLEEAKFARELGRLYQKDMSTAERNLKFLDLHLTHALQHKAELRKSSPLQGFDKNRMSRDGSDFRRDDGFVSGKLKTTDQVVHERMAERPYLDFSRFRAAGFVNMGVRHFDNGRDGCRDPEHRHGNQTSVRRFAKRFELPRSAKSNVRTK